MNIRKKKILYVDDEEVNLRLFSTTFRREYDVYTAITVREGLALLAEIDFDLIVTDQRMPEITGVQFLSMVQDLYPDIPPGRLIISGYSDPEDIEKAYKEYQLYKFVTKPWDQMELRDLFEKAMKND